MSGYFDEHGCAIVGNVAIPADLVPHFRELLAPNPKADDADRPEKDLVGYTRPVDDPAASTPDGIHLIAHHAGTANLQSADGRWWNVTVS